MSTLVSRPWRRPTVRFPWLLLGGYSMAALDTLFAIVWWAPHGVPPIQVLQTFASWVLGPAAYAGGMSSALLGAVVYAHLMWAVVVLYHRLARRHRLLLRRPLACGAAYGVVAYGFIFHLMGPLLGGSAADYSHPGWIAACVAVFMTLVGIPCALLSRVASGRR